MLRQALYFLAGSIPFLLGVFVVYAANFKKENRYRQLFMPIVALVYGIVLLITFDNVHGLVLTLVNFLRAHVGFLARLNVAVAEAILFNFLFLCAFAAVKLAFKGLFTALASPYEQGLKGLFGRWYTHDEELDRWYLREKSAGVRRLMRNLFIALVVVSVVLFVVAHVFVACSPLSLRPSSQDTRALSLAHSTPGTSDCRLSRECRAGRRPARAFPR